MATIGLQIGAGPEPHCPRELSRPIVWIATRPQPRRFNSPFLRPGFCKRSGRGSRSATRRCFADALPAIRFPASGIPVTLEAKDGPRWAQVARTRTIADGQFTFRYRFCKTVRTYTYGFRVSIGQTAGWPYDPGATNQTGSRFAFQDG